MKKIKCLVVSKENNELKIETKEIENKLDAFYKIISCDYIDIINRYIYNKKYAFPIPSAKRSFQPCRKYPPRRPPPRTSSRCPWRTSCISA